MKAWLTYLGIDIAATRLDQYSQDITEIEQARLADRQQELIQHYGRRRLVNALVEGFQLSTIFRALRNYPNQDIRQKLSLAVGGPMLPENEKPTAASNLARNVAFELLVAAQLTSLLRDTVQRSANSRTLA
jgi:hypothetical protein